ncbi:MAG: delta-60 repeat domain-containing protein [Acidobacteria bacterium]|nr:delta-60 repeat domain-containing protein [Acidobacteriota bacterium]
MAQHGNILIGGEPFTVNGGSSRSLALVDTNGVLNSSFAPSLSGTVLRIKQFADGKILVGGRFTVSSSSTLMNDLFRLNGDYSLDESFQYDFGIYQGYAYDFDRQADGKLLIGGLFGAFGGGPSKSLFRVTEDGSIDTAFTPMFGTLVNAVGVLPDHEVIVGGSRNEQIGYRNMFYRLDTNGGLGPDQPISFGFPALVASLGFLPNGKIFIAGDFEVNRKGTRRKSRGLNPDGSLDLTFNSTGGHDRDYLTLQSNLMARSSSEANSEIVNGVLEDKSCAP